MLATQINTRRIIVIVQKIPLFQIPQALIIRIWIIVTSLIVQLIPCTIFTKRINTNTLGN